MNKPRKKRVLTAQQAKAKSDLSRKKIITQFKSEVEYNMKYAVAAGKYQSFTPVREIFIIKDDNAEQPYINGFSEILEEYKKRGFKIEMKKDLNVLLSNETYLVLTWG